MHLEAEPKFADTCRESLRLFPPIPATKRYARDSMALGRHNVAPGDMLCGATYTLHHDADLWENPTAFMPVRFTFPLLFPPETRRLSSAAGYNHNWLQCTDHADGPCIFKCTSLKLTCFVQLEQSQRFVGRLGQSQARVYAMGQLDNALALQCNRCKE